jgi:predicted DNA-binding transcriptional regulator YafY
MLDVERRHKLIRLLRSHRSMSKQALLKMLETSPATFKRDLVYLRDRAGAVIEFDRELGGYVLHEKPGADPEYLPGLWFSAGEIHALLTLYRLAESLEPSLLGKHLSPVVAKLEKQLEGGGVDRELLTKRIRVLHMAHRAPDRAAFEKTSIATLGRRQLKVLHFHRGKGERLERVLSPQHLVHYRDNWYLDAWCHTRQALRSFALDAIESVTMLDAPAKSVSDSEMDAHYASSFGIFGGKADKLAVLRFTPERSRWIAKEQWHPEQVLEIAPDGACTLRIPYHEPHELVMDVLRYADQVKVLEPPALRDAVAVALRKAAAQY